MIASSPLRIAVVVHTFPTLTETFVLEPIVRLLEEGHEVEVLALFRGRESEAHAVVHSYGLLDRTHFLIDERPGRAPIRKLLRGGRILMRTPSDCLPWPAIVRDVTQPQVMRLAPELVLAALGAAAVDLRSSAFDVIHSHMGPVGLIAQYLRDWGLLRGPLLATFHGSDVLAEPKRHPAGLYHRLFMSAELMTANTHFLRDQMIALGAPPQRVVQASVGVDVAALPFRERTLDEHERVRLLTVARLNAWKGVEYGIEAVGRLAAEGVDVGYTVIGDGPRRAEFEALIRTRGLGDRVTLTGGLPWDQVLDAYNHHHIFLLPGTVGSDGGREAQGKVLAEAQACGLPIVATTVGGIPEAVAPNAGHLVEPGDPVALASAVRALMREQDSWGVLGRRGRAFVEQKFNNDKLLPQMVKRYRVLATESISIPGEG